MKKLRQWFEDMVFILSQVRQYNAELLKGETRMTYGEMKGIMERKRRLMKWAKAG